MKKDRIAWECPHCGHRHLWTWERGKAKTGPITMLCYRWGCRWGCGGTFRTELVRIAENVWAAVWRAE